MFTMKEAIEIYENNGGYFFNPVTMKFFGSKVESELFPDRCFVTSEKMGFDSAERAYTVRQFNEDFTDVHDVSGFGQFKIKKNAVDFAKMGVCRG